MNDISHDVKHLFGGKTRDQVRCTLGHTSFLAQGVVAFTLDNSFR